MRIIGLCLLFFSFDLFAAGLHTAPIIIQGKKAQNILYQMLHRYRLYKTTASGDAVPIPFQIDEKDHYGDFILPHGRLPNTKFSNGIFDEYDELSFMGNDVGEITAPTQWQGKKPSLVYKIDLSFKKKKGAVYVGIFLDDKDIPKPITQSYVAFDLGKELIKTSKYEYHFNKKNYLVVKEIDMFLPSRHQIKEEIVLSSTFYLKTDFKYFLTFEINEESIQSELEAYKIGPIRTITRVAFNYSFMKMNFELGMYTEVSFFSNSVILPAIVDNPLDGPKTLNKGSLFYYGFALKNKPEDFSLKTNMLPYAKGSGVSSAELPSSFWVTAQKPDYFIYLEMIPSNEMKKDKNFPQIYQESLDGKSILTRPSKPMELGQSRVNLAVSFPLDQLRKSQHEIGFQIYIDNTDPEENLEIFKNLKNLEMTVSPLSL
jgi:hypothetical protein